MSVEVLFEDGPAQGQSRRYEYLSRALPWLAWTGDAGQVRAGYCRCGDDPDIAGVWHYRQIDGS
jgi:hypothetical protein